MWRGARARTYLLHACRTFRVGVEETTCFDRDVCAGYVEGMGCRRVLTCHSVRISASYMGGMGVEGGLSIGDACEDGLQWICEDWVFTPAEEKTGEMTVAGWVEAKGEVCRYTHYDIYSNAFNIHTCFINGGFL